VPVLTPVAAASSASFSSTLRREAARARSLNAIEEQRRLQVKSSSSSCRVLGGAAAEVEVISAFRELCLGCLGLAFRFSLQYFSEINASQIACFNT